MTDMTRRREVVSVGRDLSTTKTKTNGQPVAHVMQVSANGPSSGDHFTIYPHGMTVTHMDALCHFSWNDQFYNGRKRSRQAAPCGVLSTPSGRVSSRYHLHESVVQKALAEATGRAGVTKRVSPHVMRHSFATEVTWIRASFAGYPPDH